MKIISKILFILFFAGVFSQYSCQKPVTYPTTPIIAYSNFTKVATDDNIDEQGILEFTFTDGDGDIGLAASDTLPPYNMGSKYYYDLFVKYYRKHNGVFLADSLKITDNARIPVITPSGKNKAIKGTVDVLLFINNPLTGEIYDTICFDVTMVDRALHMSNTIRTPGIIVKEH
jgi:hypothetical protein